MKSTQEAKSQENFKLNEKRQSINANIKTTETLELSDKNFKEAMSDTHLDKNSLNKQEQRGMSLI